MLTLAGGTADSRVRLAEMMAALSKAADLGMGQPVETAVSTCVAAVRLGAAAGLGTADLRDVYYLALLRYIGCNAETHALAALVGDELALRRDFAAIDGGNPAEVAALVGRYLAGATPEFARQVMRSLPELMHESFAGHCEVAQRLATRMGLPETLIACLGQLYERWDGRGPGGVSGEAVAVAVRVVALAEAVVVWSRAHGLDEALSTARTRSGTAYEPRLVEALVDDGASILKGLDEAPGWAAMLELEPAPQAWLDDDGLERCCEAFADFVDIKSPYTLGHSTAVARLAAGAGRRAGLPDADVAILRRAALLHDIGRAGVSAGTWGKPGPLSEREWEAVRLHPYYTERVLAHCDALTKPRRLASQHHERLDGSGYHRGLAASSLSTAARILAAADAYEAMTQPRPHRPALEREPAAAQLRLEVREGRLDGDAVDAVLAEAGHAVARTRRERPAGLSAREVEVVRLLARGLHNREVAERLHIAPDTVKRHVQHIYDKTGVSTRAGVTLFAMESALLEEK